MRTLITTAISALILAVATGCGKSDAAIEVTEQNHDMMDSLMTAADSIIHERGLLDGRHIHNGKDLAFNAHQDPLTKRKGIYTLKMKSEGRKRSRLAAINSVAENQRQ